MKYNVGYLSSENMEQKKKCSNPDLTAKEHFS
jgi:hypothetical protein